ncbi:hypothetical protein [Pseudomonas sp. PS02302]|uniref:hypothetical protein n=1 Tax=Pseudomonas sp. PS02302 TaxID=2991428 RepID=UPI00249CE37D|nr:hypothetical protein [Pseudomonas sp. PS02302]
MTKTLLSLAALILLASCSDENRKVRGQFIAGCMNGGASKSLCQCTFEKLEAKYSPTELQAVNQSATPSEKIMQDVLHFAMACRTES